MNLFDNPTTTESALGRGNAGPMATHVFDAPIAFAEAGIDNHQADAIPQRTTRDGAVR